MTAYAQATTEATASLVRTAWDSELHALRRALDGAHQPGPPMARLRLHEAKQAARHDSIDGRAALAALGEAIVETTTAKWQARIAPYAERLSALEDQVAALVAEIRTINDEHNAACQEGHRAAEDLGLEVQQSADGALNVKGDGDAQRFLQLEVAKLPGPDERFGQWLFWGGV
jgi:hypothetical protein